MSNVKRTVPRPSSISTMYLVISAPPLSLGGSETKEKSLINTLRTGWRIKERIMMKPKTKIQVSIHQIKQFCSHPTQPWNCRHVSCPWSVVWGEEPVYLALFCRLPPHSIYSVPHHWELLTVNTLQSILTDFKFRSKISIARNFISRRGKKKLLTLNLYSVFLSKFLTLYDKSGPLYTTIKPWPCQTRKKDILKFTWE